MSSAQWFVSVNSVASSTHLFLPWHSWHRLVWQLQNVSVQMDTLGASSAPRTNAGLTFGFEQFFLRKPRVETRGGVTRRAGFQIAVLCCSAALMCRLLSDNAGSFQRQLALRCLILRRNFLRLRDARNDQRGVFTLQCAQVTRQASSPHVLLLSSAEY